MTQTADDIRSLWQSMPTDTLAISADEMRDRAQKFQGRIRIRNFVEYAAFAIVLVWFGYAVVMAQTWQAKGAAALMILGAGIAVWNLHRLARAAPMPASASADTLIDFQRNELARQRDAARSLWRWYLLPMIPGFVVFSIVAWNGYLRDDIPMERLQTNIIVFNIVLAGFLIIIVLINLLGAAHLQRRIDDLDRYREKT
jgi:hypothetical protein